MNDAIEIRQATLADLDQLLMLLPQMTARAASAGAQMPPREEAVHILAQIIGNDTSQLFVAVEQEQNRVLGSLTLIVIPNLTYGGRPWAMIENVVVDHSVRRSGIGRQLLTTAIQVAKAQGCYKVQLISGAKLEQLAFYHSFGFQSDTCVGHKLYLNLA